PVAEPPSVALGSTLAAIVRLSGGRSVADLWPILGRSLAILWPICGRAGYPESYFNELGHVTGPTSERCDHLTRDESVRQMRGAICPSADPETHRRIAR